MPLQRRLPLLVILLFFGWQAVTLAAIPTNERPEVKTFIAMMEKKHRFDGQQLDRLFAQVRIREKIISAMTRPAEGKPWYQYRPIFVTDKRTRKGVEYWRTNVDDLRRAEETYGVPAEIITAIIGVESYYGRHKGRDRVIDALSTLGFDYPARGRFFRSELEQFLLLAREEGADPLSFKGSYAGAMGKAQFIPSSYRNYAIDFNGDQRRDLINSNSDAIGSVANYLKRHGWQRGDRIAVPARVHGQGYRAVLEKGLKPKMTIAQMKASGIVSETALPADTMASLIALEQKDGTEYWLGLKNFYVITRYNHSPLYAMAVYQLAEAIRQHNDRR